MGAHRLLIGSRVSVAAAILTVVCVALLPWHRSGSVERSGFELARSLDIAGYVDTPWRRVLLVAVALLPLIAAFAFTAAAANRGRAAATAAIVSGVVAGVAALTVWRVSGVEVGPLTTLACALASVLAGVSALSTTRGRHDRTD